MTAAQPVLDLSDALDGWSTRAPSERELVRLEKRFTAAGVAAARGAETLFPRTLHLGQFGVVDAGVPHAPELQRLTRAFYRSYARELAKQYCNATGVKVRTPESLELSEWIITPDTQPTLEYPPEGAPTPFEWLEGLSKRHPTHALTYGLRLAALRALDKRRAKEIEEAEHRAREEAQRTRPFPIPQTGVDTLFPRKQHGRLTRAQREQLTLFDREHPKIQEIINNPDKYTVYQPSTFGTSIRSRALLAVFKTLAPFQRGDRVPEVVEILLPEFLTNANLTNASQADRLAFFQEFRDLGREEHTFAVLNKSSNELKVDYVQLYRVLNATFDNASPEEARAICETGAVTRLPRAFELELNPFLQDYARRLMVPGDLQHRLDEQRKLEGLTQTPKYATPLYLTILDKRQAAHGGEAFVDVPEFLESVLTKDRFDRDRRKTGMAPILKKYEKTVEFLERAGLVERVEKEYVTARGETRDRFRVLGPEDPDTLAALDTLETLEEEPITSPAPPRRRGRPRKTALRGGGVA